MLSCDQVINVAREQMATGVAKKGFIRRIFKKIGLAQKEVAECKGKSLQEMAEMTSKKDCYAHNTPKVLDNKTKIEYLGNRKVAEITPQGIERRFAVNGEIKEFKPDKVCITYKDGNIIKEEPWEYIGGARIDLSQAEHLLMGDHLGHITLEENYYKELENFTNKYREQ